MIVASVDSTALAMVYKGNGPDMPTLDWIGKKAVVNHHRDVLSGFGVSFKQIPDQIEGL